MTNRFCSLILFCTLALATTIQAAVVFDRGATWRWRSGTSEASTPVEAWRTNGFNDAQFITASAPFWYGDVLPGGTQITNMQNNYLCIFLRLSFVVTNVSEVAGLRLGALVDDGFVAWINGREVQRVNMPDPPDTPVAISNLANNATEPVSFSFYNLPTPSAYLVPGTNIIAVQVFQSSLNSSDLGFDASLEAILVETNPPTVLSASPAADSTVPGLSAITVTFSEPVTGVDAAAFLINGVAASGFTSNSSTVYSFAFPQPAYGTVLITWSGSHSIADQALPPNPFNATGPGATWQYTLVDLTPPAVVTLSPAANATLSTLTNLIVVFSEGVANVDAADLRINNTPATGVSGGGDTYTFSFPAPAAGLVQVAWAADHGITDLAASPNAFVAGGTWFYTLDPNVGQTGGPIISEFMALNTANAGQPGAYLDENGDSSDWIEIQNTSSFTVNLLDWSLTDAAGNLTKWRFPATNLASGGFLVVFASEKDRRVPGARLHTNFKLGNSEYLALVRPDGTIASEFAPYPPQVANISYGLGVLSTNSILVASNGAVRVLIPSSGADGTNWLYAGFDDSAWTAGTNGVGYGTTNVTAADYSATVLPTGPLVYYRMSETAGTTVANLGSLGAAANGSYVNNPTLGAAGPRPPSFNGFEANNNAVQLIGTANTDYVQGPAGLLTSRAAFTIAGWIRPTGAQAARTGLFGQNDTVEFGFISAGTIQAWTPNGSIGSYTYPYPDNEWHHIALVGAGGQFTIYVDGTSRISAAATAGAAAGNFNIGGGGIFDTTGNDFLGQMDEVAMWDRALSAAELMDLYTAGTTPAGVSVVPYVKTQVGGSMSNVNASAYIRMPFTIENPANVQFMKLRVRYDDGFVAYLNGIEVVRANAPGALGFNSAATDTHTAAPVDEFQIGGALLRPGANVLAIQGLNIAANDEDFLISAELTATHNAAASGSAVYMTVPSPGAANGAGVSVLGPAITDARHSPNVPLDAQDLLVTARVTPTFAPIGSVAVRYRVMFTNEIELPMNDLGTNGDAVASDGVYSCTLPIAAASTNGQMIRWYFRATDTLNRVSRWPLFQNSVGEEYLGTVVDPSYVTSKLPIFHLFATNGVLQTPHLPPAIPGTGADGESGGRVAIFYDGEFYDNVYMELRGNTSAGQNKKSHRLEFNHEHTFRHLPGFPRVLKTSLMAEFLDPTYLRQHLCFWLLDQMGMPSPYFYPVRAQLNGSFYALVFHNDVIGQGQVERMGYDPKGALYKAAGNVLLSRSSTGVFQKLEPDGPPDYTDYNELANGIVETAPVANRRIAAFDLLDIPEVINYLAGARWCAENDDVWANMSLHRDTYGDQLWRIIPFDMNASWGQRYGGITPLDAIADSCKSHPLYGGSTTIACDGSSYNRIYDVIIALPETRQMLLRRQRTILDRWVMEPGVPSGSRLLETHIRHMTNLIWTEAFLDRASWGYSTWTASNKPLNTGVDELFNEFIALRRIHFSATHCVTNVAKPIGINKTDNAGIPVSQPTNAVVAVSSLDFNPVSGNQAQEYICFTNPNPTALDISGWKLDGAVNFTFKPGTVIPSNSVFYVASDLKAFRARATGPRGGQGLFVVGPYKGQLSARGESVVIVDDTSRLVASNSYAGNPSLPQQYLRISELMYNPLPLGGNTNDAQEFEFIELKNISPVVTLDLRGVHFTNGIEFSFTGSAVTNLAPGQRVLIVKNLAAFAARYGAGVLNIAGDYTGYLNNGGERLTLLDAMNEEILDFSYNNSWYPITDGLGFSLVVANENADWRAWGEKANWRASGEANGSPGQDNLAPPVFLPVFVNEVLANSVFPQYDSIELYNPNAVEVDIGNWFLSDDFRIPKKYQIPTNTIVPPFGYLVFTEEQFNPGGFGFALSANGDEAYVFSADANGTLTGYFHGFNVGASAPSTTLGRYVTSIGEEHFVLQAANTLGTNNAGPAVGPVVITEIMFHPPDVWGIDPNSYNYGNLEYVWLDDSLNEFIELYNITTNTVSLYDPAAPTNTWRLRGGVDFQFPTNVVLPSNGYALLVNFDPATNAVQAAAFRSRYNLTANVPLFGPYGGKLNNDEDNVELARPVENFYVLVDKVHYYDTIPWPCGGDGTGNSLQRLVAAEYGNDPLNWATKAPTTGAATVPQVAGLAAIVAEPVDVVAAVNGQATLAVTVCSVSPVAYQWRFNGTNLVDATNAVLALANVQLSQSGFYSAVVSNAVGSLESRQAQLWVQLPPAIVTQPTNQTVLGFSTVTLAVEAGPTPPFWYQWKFNGTNLVGATNSTLVLPNVQKSQAGQYSVLVWNTAGQVQSATNTLLVNVPAKVLGVVVTPATLTATNATTVTFTATVAGDGAVSNQWYFNSAPLSNGTSSTLTLANVQAQNEGTYQLVVSNSFGINTSAVYFLTVYIKPGMAVGPVSQVVSLGEPFIISVTVTGTPPFQYRWQKVTTGLVTNYSSLPTDTFTLPNMIFSDVGLYRATIVNIASSTSSGFGYASVADPPANRQVLAGSNVTLTATLVMPSGLTGYYQWSFAGTNLTNTLSLALTNVQPDQAGTYTLMISNSQKAVRYYTCQLTVQTEATAPAIVRQPDSAVAALGGKALFTMEATGTDPLSYQWWFMQTNLVAGGTNRFLTFTNVVATNLGSYVVVVSNTVGTTTSAVAMLGLAAPPAFYEQPTNQVVNAADSAIFAVSVTGSAPLSYQWWFNGTNLLAGRTNAALSLADVQLANAGNYQVVVSNIYGAITSLVATLTVNAVVVDSDGDGIPDAWERDHGLVVGVNDALLDSDGDGLSNFQEYLAGTDPLSKGSVLKLETPVNLSGTGQLTLSFNAMSNHTYTVEWRSAVTGQSWQTLLNVPLAPSNYTVIITNQLGTNVQQYFRLGTP